MKNIAFFFVALLSLNVQAQLIDLSKSNYSLNDSMVKNSDTLKLDISRIMVFDIKNLTEEDELEILANYFKLGLNDINGNPTTYVGDLIFDFRHYLHRKKVVKNMRKQLTKKMVIFYNSELPEKSQDSYYLYL